ncbi:MAG: RHS repeat-associated protein, partial [Bradymonadia bacterium]
DGSRRVFVIVYEFAPFFPIGGFSFAAPAGSGASLTSPQACAVANTQAGVVCFDTGRPVRESLSTYELTTREGTVWVIDQDDGLQRATDREGNRIEYLQDAIRSTLGPEILLERDEVGRITRMTDPRGGVVTYAYDAAGDLARVVDQAGGEQQYNYDDNHTLAEIIDPAGNPMVRSEYDDAGRKTVDIDALGNRTEYAYDLDGRERTVTDRRGGVNRYVYDAIGQVTERENPGGGVMRMTYNVDGQLVTEELAPDQSFDYAYDAAGNQREVTDLRGVRHQFSWQQGQLVEAVDALGHRIAVVRDAQGRVTDVTNASGGTVRIAYDAGGNRASVTDAMGGATQFTYDALGNVASKAGPGGFARVYEYDAAANLTSMFDSAGELYEFEYDAVGRMARLIPPDGAAIVFERDGLGRLTRIIDADGAQWRTAYTPRGAVAEAIDPNGNVTAYSYGPEGALTQTQYANGDRVQYVVTIDGFNAERIDPLGNRSRYEFSPEAKVLARVDRNGQRVVFGDNLSGNIDRREVIGGSLDVWEFDLGDRLARMARDAQEWLLEYDDDDRLTRAQGPNADLSYTYDLAGRRTAMIGPDGQTTYEHDGRGRLAAVTAPGAGRVAYTRDGEGRVTRVSFPNGVEVNYSFDIAGRPLGFATVGGDQAVEELLELDPVGRPISIVAEDDGLVTLEYDQAGQLTRFNRAGGDAPATDLRYRYDGRGTRTGITIDGQATDAEVIGDARVVTEAGATTQYDPAGSTVERILPGQGITQTFEYDAQRHLVRVDVADGGAGSAVEYTYDPLGRRTARTVDGVTTFEVVDSGEITWRLDDQGAVIERFVHGDRVDEMLAYVTPAGALYPVLDTRGNVAAVYDAAGDLVARYSYDPWGERSLRDGDVDLPFGFGARPIEPITGLYDFRARTYSPTAGRFLQQDPESGVRARAITQHPYAYANNNPYTMRDPSGRSAAIGYAFLSSRFVTGSAGGEVPTHTDVMAAMIGFFHGFGATALVFLANILEIANNGGDVLDQWGAAIAATQAKMDEIAGQLERLAGLDDSGFAGSFVNGAKFEVGISFSLDIVPDLINKAVEFGSGDSINQSASLKMEASAGGFNSGVTEALNFIGLHGPR